MKKMLGKRTMFLVALLVGLCSSSIAQQVPVEGGVYYVQNVATGLYLKYGGVWGTHVVEGRAAHPIMIEDNGDGTYALSSIAGFLNSTNLYMDQPENTSYWTLQKVGENNEYYLLGDRGRVLASQGNKAGDLDLKIFNQTDTRHKWVFKTKEDIIAEMSAEGVKAPSKENPIDVTPLIKASGFDLVDGERVDSTEKYKGDIPLDGHVLNVGANPNSEDHYNGSYLAYNNYWENYGPHSKFSWHSMTRGEWGDPNSYCSVGVLTHDAFYQGWEKDGQTDQETQNNITNHYKAINVTQSLGTLPAGTYYFTFNGFYNYYKEVVTQKESRNWNQEIQNSGDPTVKRTDIDMTVNVSIAGQTFKLNRNKDILVYGSPEIVKRDNKDDNKTRYYYNYPNTGVNAALALKDASQYKYAAQFTLSQPTDVKITISYPKTEQYNRNAPNFSLGGSRTVTITYYPNWVCLDNFNLLYFGNDNQQGQDMADYYNKLLNDYIAELREKILSQYPDGLQTFNDGVSSVESDMVQRKIDTELEYLDALNTIDQAYKNAIIAHFRAQGKEYDCTSLIQNHSFEEGEVNTANVNGWTKVLSYGGGDNDYGVKENVDGNAYYTRNAHGYYLFNVWGGWNENTNTAYIEQTINDLEPGLYELKALLASHPGNMVYIKASDLAADGVKRNTYNVGVRAQQNDYFEEATLYFLVEPTAEGGQVGAITIGAIGGNSGATGRFDYYWPNGGCYFKADNFRLKYMSDLANGYLKLALHEAENTALDVYGKAVLDASLAEYKTMFDNRQITTIEAGKAAAKVVYDKLQSATKVQKLASSNMTYAIYNPGFDWDNSVMFPSGWTCATGNDTGARMQDNGTYSVVGSTGRFLFNTWDGGKASSLTQQNLSGLPSGKYQLRVMVASDNENVMVVSANGVPQEVAAIGATLGVFPTVDCEVGSDGKLAIEVKEKNGKWYKCDNFQLTLIKPNMLVLEEGDEIIADIQDVEYPNVKIQRTIKPGATWSSFVLPFNMSIPTGWDVKELTGASVRADGENITLRFTQAKSIVAGKPYMIRTNSASEIKEVPGSNVLVNTGFQNSIVSTDCGSYDLEFVGVYTKGKVPASASDENGVQYFFISGNKFYRSVTGTDNIKGFRAYFKVTPKSAGVNALRSLSMQIGDETVIGAAATDEVTVVAIYDVSGMRISEVKTGINILRMSDGSTKKVLIK